MTTAGSAARLDTVLDSSGVTHFVASELLRCPQLALARSLGVELDGRLFAAHDQILVPMVGVALAAEALRSKIGLPLIVRSGYRPSAYNSAVGGAAGSQHRHGRALDLTTPLRGNLSRLHDLCWLAWCDGLIGGFGSYQGNVHIDIRHEYEGYPVVWGSQIVTTIQRWIAAGGTLTRHQYDRVARRERKTFAARGIARPLALSE